MSCWVERVAGTVRKDLPCRILFPKSCGVFASVVGGGDISLRR